MSKLEQSGRIIISTVGKSAILNITNPNNKKFLPSSVTEEDIQQLKKDLENFDNGLATTKTLLYIMLKLYPEPDPRTKFVPAEISSLGLIPIPANPSDRLFFLAGTRQDQKADAGAVCGMALTEYYKQAGFLQTEFREISGFTTKDGEIPYPEALLEKLDELVSQLRKDYPEQKILINFTGGYKIGGVYSALVALVHSCEAYYLFEGNNQPVALPAIDHEQLALLIKPQKKLSLNKYLQLGPSAKNLYHRVGSSYVMGNLAHIVTRLDASTRTASDGLRQRRKQLEVNIKNAEKVKSELEEQLGVYLTDPAEKAKIKFQISKYDDQIEEWVAQIEQIEAILKEAEANE